MDYSEAGKWIEERLTELGEYTGKNGEIWRAAYTRQEAKGKTLLAKWIRQAGLLCYEDPLGNLYGRLSGKGEGKGTILVGSHIDTVKGGGKYDGATGVVSAIAALSYLKRQGYEPECNVEVVGLLEEEGSRYPSSCHGSRSIVGSLKKEHLEEKDREGISYAEAMRRAGYDPGRFEEARREDIRSYIELHIEQGAILEQRRKKIGIVGGIVGIVNYDITITGQQNHAGTTPMDMRKDPVAEAAFLIAEMTERIKGNQSKTTATFGSLQSFPGMQNVVAESVSLTLDLRDGDREALAYQEDWFLSRLNEMKIKGFQVEAVRTQCSDPVKMDDGLVSILVDAAETEGLSAMKIYSGAGHDAMVFAERQIPSAMIFIPSRDGISHNPLEYTTSEDLQAGFAVLCRMIPMADKQIEVKDREKEAVE